MKKLLVLFLSVLMLNVGCIRHIKSTEVQEINDELLDNLSKDLAEIHIMVENAQEKYKKEELAVKIVEPWTESLGLEFAYTTTSGREVFDVIAKSKVEVPTKDDWMTVAIFKLAGKKNKFIGVWKADYWEKSKWERMMMSLTKESVAGGQQIRFYDPQLGADPISVEAIKQYVSFTSRLEDTARKILDKLKDLQKKYEGSPIYIEGFSIQFPLISVTVQFKFRSK